MKCSLAHALSLPTIATRQSCPSVGFHLDEENGNRKPKIARIIVTSHSFQKDSEQVQQIFHR
ncbi:hypothetical protein, partial [Pseudomonas aeruginosa]